MRIRAFAAVAALLSFVNSCDSSTAPPVAVKVGFTVNPGTVTAGTAIAPSLTIAAQDANGATVTGSTASVTVSISAGTGTAGATLGGTTTRAAVNGVATFNDLTIDKAGTGYTLTATVVGLTVATTTAFNVVAGAPSKLVVSTQPSNAVSGAAIAPAVVVGIQDAFGNATTATSTVAVAITSGTGTAGAILGGTASVAAVAGSATFSNLSVDKAGTGYTLTATSTGLTAATTSAFNITVGAAAKLAVTVQPTTTTSTGPITPSIAITVQDAAGNTVTSSSASITVAITGGTGTGGAILSGTKTVSAASGVASFGSLSIDKSGTGYTLTASASGLTSATTNAFTIVPGFPAKLGVSVQPTNVASGSAISPSVVILVQDASGNTVIGASNSVAVAITGGTGAGGALLGGTQTVSASAGVATFSTLTVDKASAGYTLTATSSGLTSITTSAFTVSAGAAANVTLNAAPAASATVATAVSTKPSVLVTDAAGNPKSGTTVNFVVIGGGGSGTSLSPTTGADGIATAGSWTLGTVAGTNTMTAAVGSLTPVTFTVTGNPGAAAIITQTAGSFTGRANTAVAVPPSVKVTDAHNNVLSGVSVTFAVTGGGGSIGGTATKSTNGSGIASPDSWTLGPSISANSMEAQVSGLTALSIDVDMFMNGANQLSAGDEHTCAVSTTGNAYCWGQGATWNIGTGSQTSQSKPTKVAGSIAIQTIHAGFQGVCIKTFSEAGYCWGMNSEGLVGNGTFTAVSTITGPNNTGTSYSSMGTTSGGARAMCGVTSAPVVRCWGGNTSGQLGNGGFSNTANNGAVGDGGFKFNSVFNGALQTCAIEGPTSTAPGIAHCWGAGHLGNGTTAATGTRVTVSGGLLYSTLTVGGKTKCGVTTGGALYCWGDNTGNGSGTQSLTPTLVDNVKTWTEVAAGANHACALDNGGTAYCWGDNSLGQVGNGGVGTTINAFTAVSGGLSFQRITAGANHTCGYTSGGTVYCWGSNSAGQLGDGTTTDRNVPTLVVHK